MQRTEKPLDLVAAPPEAMPLSLLKKILYAELLFIFEFELDQKNAEYPFSAKP